MRRLDLTTWSSPMAVIRTSTTGTGTIPSPSPRTPALPPFVTFEALGTAGWEFRKTSAMMTVA